jgi:hypothetical protein
MANKFDLSTVEGRQQFIVSTWPGTAGLAYAGYKAYNRGAVVFAHGYDSPMFVPLKGNDYGNPEIVKSVKEYNPEREIVVMFFLIDDSIVFERYHVASMTPAKAYQLFARLI